MKTFVKTFTFFVIMIAGTWLFSQKVSAQNEPIEQDDNTVSQQNQPVTLQVFYDELSPYGTWIENPTYGYVWVPNVDQNFSPYVTNGHWVNTDYGWTWVSDFPWGWAPFHYGRWAVDSQYGNIWIPDTVWGPAWVSWRQANGYIGWTPMGPGIDINIAMGRSYYVPRDRWMFVRDRDFMSDNLYNCRLERSLLYNIFSMSLFIRNTRYDNNWHSTYFYGPSREYVQRFSGRVIYPVHIRDYDRPGQSYGKDYLSIYRPRMNGGSVNGHMPAPRNINRNMSDRNGQNINRYNSAPNRSSGYQPRNVQPNSNQYRSQNVPQPSRNANSTNSDRYSQPRQQPNANQSRGQSEQQYRDRNSNYQVMNSQPVQQQAVNQQRNQQQSRQIVNAPSQRSQPAASQQRGERQSRSVNNAGGNKREESNKR